MNSLVRDPMCDGGFSRRLVRDPPVPLELRQDYLSLCLFLQWLAFHRNVGMPLSMAVRQRHWHSSPMPYTSCRSRGLRPVAFQLYLCNFWIYWIVMIQCLNCTHQGWRSMSREVSKTSVDTPIMLTNPWNIGFRCSLSSGRASQNDYSPFSPTVGRWLGTGESHIPCRYISLTESFIVPRLQQRSLAPLIIPCSIVCVPGRRNLHPSIPLEWKSIPIWIRGRIGSGGNLDVLEFL